MSPPHSNSAPGSRSLAVITSLSFLTLICGLPLLQLAGDVSHSPRTCPTPFRLLPELSRAISAPNQTGSLISRVTAANHRVCRVVRDYETLVTETAWPVQTPRAWLQSLLAGPLRSGNEQVVVGPDRELYFRPDIAALTGPPFLLPPVARPGMSIEARQANPLPAIQQFASDLRLRGIELWLLPIPSKATQLAWAHSCNNATPALHNPSYPLFLAELARNQIALCDVSHVLPTPAPSATGYLRTDSHWSPAGLQRVVQSLATHLKTSIVSDPGPVTDQFQTARSTVENVGDIARLLGPGTSGQTVSPEHCEITQVLNSQGLPWTPDPASPILLLGDSFTNIYSQPELGWGTSAGLSEQLSLALGFRIDRIALNAGGAQATRRELVRQMRQGTDRLAGKRIVIWQFAERELSQGDWQLIPLPAPASKLPTPDPAKSAPSGTSTIQIDAVVAQSGHLPDPATLPYREALVPLHLRQVRTAGTVRLPDEIVVYVWGVRDRKRTPAADLQVGQPVHFNLIPWSQAELQFGRFARAELDDPDFRLIDLPTYWATPVP